MPIDAPMNNITQYLPYSDNYHNIPNTLKGRSAKYHPNRAFEHIPWVYTCCDVIASSIASVPLVFFRDKRTNNSKNIRRLFTSKILPYNTNVRLNGKPLSKLNGKEVSNVTSSRVKSLHKRSDLINGYVENGDIEYVSEDEPVYKLFNPPLPFEINSLSELNYLTVLSLVLVGEIFWIYDFDRRKVPTNILIESAYYMKPNTDRAKKRLFGWDYYENPANIKPTKHYKFGELLQFRLPSPYHRWRGMPPLKAGRTSMEQWSNIAIWNAGRFKEGSVRTPLAIEYEGSLDSSDERQLLKRVAKTYSGFLKGHTPFIVDGGGKIKTLFNKQDLDYLQGQGYTREDIISILHVPPAIAGILDNANYSNSDAQEEFFWTICNLPKMTLIRDILQVNLLDRVFPGVFVDWDWPYVDVLRDDPIEGARTILIKSTAVKNYAVTKLYNKAEIANIIGDPTLAGFGEDTIEEPEETEDVQVETIDLADYVVISKENGCVQYKYSDSFLTKYSDYYVKFILGSYTDRWHKMYKAFLKSAIQDISLKLKSNIKLPLNNLEWNIIWNESQNKFVRDLLSETLTRLKLEITSPNKVLNNFFNTKIIDVNEHEEYVLDWIEQELSSRSGFIDTTINKLNNVLYNANGNNNKEIEQELLKVSNMLLNANQNKIGRTTVAYIYNGSKYIFSNLLGVTHHEWVCNKGKASRETHVKEHARVVKMGSLFPETNLLYPLDSSAGMEKIYSCTCTTIPAAMAGEVTNLESREELFKKFEEIIKPYTNEYSCRILSPSGWDRIKRINCDQKHNGKCIDVIYGIKNNKAKIQALRYKKSIWTSSAARSHCKSRGGSFDA